MNHSWWSSYYFFTGNKKRKSWKNNNTEATTVEPTQQRYNNNFKNPSASTSPNNNRQNGTTAAIAMVYLWFTHRPTEHRARFVQSDHHSLSDELANSGLPDAQHRRTAASDPQRLSTRHRTTAHPLRRSNHHRRSTIPTTSPPVTPATTDCDTDQHHLLWFTREGNDIEVIRSCHPGSLFFHVLIAFFYSMMLVMIFSFSC